MCSRSWRAREAATARDPPPIQPRPGLGGCARGAAAPVRARSAIALLQQLRDQLEALTGHVLERADQEVAGEPAPALVDPPHPQGLEEGLDGRLESPGAPSAQPQPRMAAPEPAGHPPALLARDPAPRAPPASRGSPPASLRAAPGRRRPGGRRDEGARDRGPPRWSRRPEGTPRSPDRARPARARTRGAGAPRRTRARGSARPPACATPRPRGRGSPPGRRPPARQGRPPPSLAPPPPAAAMARRQTARCPTSQRRPGTGVRPGAAPGRARRRRRPRSQVRGSPSSASARPRKSSTSATAPPPRAGLLRRSCGSPYHATWAFTIIWRAGAV